MKPGMKHLKSTAFAIGIVLSMPVGNLQAQQVPIPKTPAEVPGPALGPMTKAYVPLGALAGEYAGVSGDVGIGLGAGVNVILGGSNRTVALQPISLQGSIALNVVAGVSSLKLRPLPM